MSREISKYHDMRNARIASQAENWCDDLYLSYYLNSRYYGKIKEPITDEQLKKELINYNIQYFFVHGKLKNHIDILKPYEKINGITIYEVATAKDAFSG